MHSIFYKIKEAFTFEKPSNFIWECIDCGEKFDDVWFDANSSSLVETAIT